MYYLLPPQLSEEVFAKIKDFPDPMVKDDGHYKSFVEPLGSVTCEERRPPCRKGHKKDKTFPFYPSVQHVEKLWTCADV